MRAKKGTGRSQSIRYLLSLDRTLRRPSVRRLVERVKPVRRRTAAQATAKSAAKPVARAAKPTARRIRTARAADTARNRRQSSVEPRTILLGLGCVVIAAAFLAVRGPEPEDDAQIARITDPSFAESSPQVNTAAADDTEVAPGPISRPAPVRPAVSRVQPEPTLRTAALTTPPVRETATEVESTPVPAIAADTAATPVTVSGCLAENDDTYRLTDTSGDLAPKSRSWKSGFLKKRSPSIELINAAHLRLASHVGKRIETTGVIEDREMRVKTLRVQGSCD